MRTHLSLIGLTCLALTLLAGTCEEQDFHIFTTPFTVSADKPIDSALFDHPIRVTRHNLDYTISNTSDATTYVVIDARSLLSSESGRTVRGQGSEIFTLEPGSEQSGRISELDLTIGDAIEVNLTCCESSACTRRDVECLEPKCDAYPSLCLEGCSDTSLAVTRSGCASDQCLVACLDNHQSCCELSPPEPDSTCLVPCCDDPSCADFTCAPDTLSCSSSDSGCTGYLTRCVQGCEDPAVRTCGRELCIEACLSAFANLSDCCSRSTVCDAPCCFEESCEATMDAIVKLSAIECLDDSTACSTGQFCNERGLCENRVGEASSCALSSPRRPTSLPRGALLLAAIALFLSRRRLRASQAERPGDRAT